MPITSSAKKKMRRDIRKRVLNSAQKAVMKKSVKTARQNPNPDTLKVAQKNLDKAAKNNLMHKNKAARLKSRLSKLLKKSN